MAMNMREALKLEKTVRWEEFKRKNKRVPLVVDEEFGTIILSKDLLIKTLNAEGVPYEHLIDIQANKKSWKRDGLLDMFLNSDSYNLLKVKANVERKKKGFAKISNIKLINVTFGDVVSYNDETLWIKTELPENIQEGDSISFEAKILPYYYKAKDCIDMVLEKIKNVKK